MSLRLLAFAAVSGRVAYVFLIGDRLWDWRVSDTAAKSTGDAASWARCQIDDLVPEIIVTEQIAFAAKKGEPAKEVIQAIGQLAEDTRLLDVRIKRERPYQNKYEEAEAIAESYPLLTNYVPQKRWFADHEPRHMVLFEAMALALSVIRGPSTQLAAAMG